jgi:hypothetical protein
MATSSQIEAHKKRHFRKLYVEQTLLQLLVKDRESIKKKIADAMLSNGCNPSTIDEEAELALKEYVESIYS